MTSLELLAPARNKDIGIAAIDCGADAVYIAGPSFGARKDAGNPVGDIAALCEYAHRYGVRIYVTFNIEVRDDELPEMHSQMLLAQDAGADAFIIRDERAASWDDIRVPLHASTQCAIRDVSRARHFEALGCTRLILERELSLEQVRRIASAVGCEIEFFVHGALCVCYSGECRLSEYLDGRSADRGECIQACRSLYDLEDSTGRVIARDKALLSLKDLNLLDRLEDLASAGVCSFKIEGRLKNASYVKNVVREYSIALDRIVSTHPGLYRRASFGKVVGGFEPDSRKTFNRGYTSLFLDSGRGKWASIDAPKSIGEPVGRVRDIRRTRQGCEIVLDLAGRDAQLRNGDGFSYVAGSTVCGFRGDVCEGNRILCKSADSLRKGMVLHRNLSAAFEKEIESKACRREIGVSLSVRISGSFDMEIRALAEDGKVALSPFKMDLEAAQNAERAEAMIREGLSKRAEQYSCRVDSLLVDTPGGRLPLLSSSTINSIRRAVVSDLAYPSVAVSGAAAGLPAAIAGPEDRGNGPSMAQAAPAANNSVESHASADGSPSGQVCPPSDTLEGGAQPAGWEGWSERSERNLSRTELPSADARGAVELMRSKYCVRYELGLCPVHQGAADSGQLYLVNNGRRLPLRFDCGRCEMTVLPEENHS